MFNFFRKKKEINSEDIKNFNDSLRAINIYILISEWGKAKFALSEIKTKENESFNTLLKKIDNDSVLYWNKEKERQIKIYKKKMEQLNYLENKLIDSERAYNIKSEKEKFNLRLKNIRSDTALLIGKGKFNEWLSLLKNFLEENKDNANVVKFFNKEKSNILKNIEKKKKFDENKIKDNTKLEALKLIWETINIENENTKEVKESFFKKIIKKLNFYKRLSEKIKNKRLLDEISRLIEEDSKEDNSIIIDKLSKMHKWLVKELKNEIIWYELYWKILWAEKISWDSFDLYDGKLKYNFFLWDATWHWIRAWFIISLISKLFKTFVEKSNLKQLCYELNNGLKQDLTNKNFITWVFFEIEKTDITKINFVWMWHEPMLLYRNKECKIETIIPWWLAAGIRLIKNIEDIKVRSIMLEDNDILIMYSDWAIENKSENWEFYWIEKFSKSFLNTCIKTKNINDIYNYVINEIKFFRWWGNFDDDVSMLLIKRNSNKDIITKSSDYLKDLTLKESLKSHEVKKLEWKNKDEIIIELENIKKIKETDRIIKILETLYFTWEILKLKQEAIRYIKEWYIHKKINYYLKKALDNETKYKIEQKSQKIKNKYNILVELYKRWEYDTVIKEIEDIIWKDGNI